MMLHTMQEWSSLPLGDADGQLPIQLADRLVRAAQLCSLPRVSPDRILRRDHRAVHSHNVVGVVATNECALEILPKIDPPPGAVSEPLASARQQLVHMLDVAMELDIAAIPGAPMAWSTDTILEILIRVFADRLLDMARLGLPRRYLNQADDLPALRGRLDTVRQFTTLAASPQKLACRFDELSPNIALNQIMKAAIRRVQRSARRTETRRRLLQLTFAYEDVADLPSSQLPLGDVVLDRGSARWRSLLALARLFLNDRRQSTSVGGDPGVALLFDMNVLFESYIARMLVRVLAGSDLRVISQGGLVHCLTSPTKDPDGSSGLFRTKPDLLIKRGVETLLVADTKWKRLVPLAKDRKQGVDQADIYQMMAYGQLYRCPHLLLIYPHHYSLLDCDVAAEYTVTNACAHLRWATVDLAGPQKVMNRLKSLMGSYAGPAASRSNH